LQEQIKFFATNCTNDTKKIIEYKSKTNTHTTCIN